MKQTIKSWLIVCKSKIKSIFERVKSAPQYIQSSFAINKKAIKRWYAQSWQLIYRIRNHTSILKMRYISIIVVIVLTALIVLSAFLLPTFQAHLDLYFSGDKRFEDFKTLLVTLGGALIGATAIAFSLIMFAMQVNVERMPHGLFRKFSSDRKLLGAFSITFLLAIVIIILSLIPDKSWVVVAILTSGWGTVLIIILFLYAYRRALNLISPTKQLAILVKDTRKNFHVWERGAKRTAPLLEASFQENRVDDGRTRSNHDIARVTYFNLYPRWTSVAQQGIQHCISFARRYAEQGDHLVSQTALDAIVAINRAYISAKGKTFFTDHYIFENPLSSDGFINDTLEHLRQNVQVGISRGDEQQIEQTFRAMAQLCQVYLGIDYANEHASKTHAHLAAAYLTGAVESVVPHNMPDVLMEGVRLMGQTALLILNNKEPQYIATISEKIAVLSCTGAVTEKYRPVTITGVAQLAKITLELIRSESHDISFAVRKVRADVELIAKIYLEIPDTPLSSIHSSALASYYSGANAESLQNWLRLLVNALLEALPDDESAIRVLSHIEQWADEIYRTEKDLLLLAIKKRSFLAFDIIHSIAHVTNLLLSVSNAPACDEHTRDELRRSALFLISVLSWVPDDQEGVTFVENYEMTEILFEAAINARRRECDDIALKIRDLLLQWAFKAGKYQSGWGIIERACYGLACLNIIFEIDDNVLLVSIEKQSRREEAPSLVLRRRAADEIKREANAYHRDRYALRAIESAMAGVDQDRLRTLLNGISDRLTPEVAEQREENQR